MFFLKANKILTNNFGSRVIKSKFFSSKRDADALADGVFQILDNIYLSLNSWNMKIGLLFLVHLNLSHAAMSGNPFTASITYLDNIKAKSVLEVPKEFNIIWT